ncbi:MAG: hypothetical protein J7K98_02920 [Candidatus Aenigmarchaeota archaeon]|nr:hypothetical protein [Candidatus Aenigmarchaeota archaeon]
MYEKFGRIPEIVDFVIKIGKKYEDLGLVYSVISSIGSMAKNEEDVKSFITFFEEGEVQKILQTYKEEGYMTLNSIVKGVAFATSDPSRTQIVIEAYLDETIIGCIKSLRTQKAREVVPESLGDIAYYTRDLEATRIVAKIIRNFWPTSSWYEIYSFSLKAVEIANILDKRGMEDVGKFIKALYEKLLQESDAPSVEELLDGYYSKIKHFEDTGKVDEIKELVKEIASE